MDKLLILLTYFCMLSVAVERAVEILKVGFFKRYNVLPATYQALAAVIGSILSYYSPPPHDFMQFDPWISVIATGLAVSGGSAFWNTILDSVTSVSKNLKPAPTAPLVEAVKN